MWMLLTLALAQDPVHPDGPTPPLEEARDLIAVLDTPEWHTQWQGFLTRLDQLAVPDQGATPINHEAVAALALAATSVDEHDHDVSLIEDGLRAQLVQRNPLRRDYDGQSIEAGATYRESLRDAVLVLGRDPRSLCIELRAIRARHQAGDAAQALALAQTAVQAYSHPYDVAVSEHLVGQLRLKSGEPAAALPHLQRALETYDPSARDQPHAPTLDRAILYADLAYTYGLLGEEREQKRARRALKKARKLGPSDSLWQQDQDRLEVRLGEPFQGTCWEGDTWWAMIEAGERPGLSTDPDSQ